MGDPIVGIDLGTTNCVAAIFIQDELKIIQNEQGLRTMPSYVAFTDTECLIGMPAKSQAIYNPKNTINDSKRLIGRNIKDERCRAHIAQMPYEVVEDKDVFLYKVNYKSNEELFMPEEISAKLLHSVKEYTEQYLGKKISEVVITIPAYFTQRQREATHSAAEIAGLVPVRIINEPTAAALAYGHVNKIVEQQTVFIFDLGGGTFDVSIVEIEKDDYLVKATAGDRHLGGEDFNTVMVEYFIKKFKDKHSYDISGDVIAVERLRNACESAKIQLSASVKARVEVYALHDSNNLSELLDRAEFERICAPLFDKMKNCIVNALKLAKLDKTKIDEIILVGGSTRIPKIREMLKDYFGKQLTTSINPDEAVAYGAAIQGAMLNRTITDKVLMDVIPLALGIAVHGKEMSVLIKSNTPKPFSQTCTYFTKYDNQRSIGIQIYEGEGTLVTDNHFLGKLSIPVIKPGKPGIPVEVAFEVDHNGVLKVMATEKKCNQSGNITIDNLKRVSTNQVAMMKERAKKFKQEDELVKQKIIEINSIKGKCHTRIAETVKDNVKEDYVEFITWLELHESEDLQEIQNRFLYLEELHNADSIEDGILK